METYLLLFSLIFAEELKWNTAEIKKEKKVQGKEKWIHQKESEIKKGVRRKKSAPGSYAQALVGLLKRTQIV